MFRNTTSRSLFVVYLVIMLSKWVFSTDVGSLRVFVFDFN